MLHSLQIIIHHLLLDILLSIRPGTAIEFGFDILNIIASVPGFPIFGQGEAFGGVVSKGKNHGNMAAALFYEDTIFQSEHLMESKSINSGFFNQLHIRLYRSNTLILAGKLDEACNPKHPVISSAIIVIQNCPVDGFV